MSTKTTKRLIDWDEYRQSLAQTSPSPTTTQPPTRASPTPIPMPDSSQTEKQAAKVEQRAQTLALGHLGEQLGNWQGRGEAHVEKNETPQPLFAAWKLHDELKQKLGDRLAQQYSQQLKLADSADNRQHQAEMRKLKEDRQDERQRQKQLLDLATQTVVNTENDAPAKPAKRATAPRKAKQEQPISIADTDGQQVFGHWVLSPDEAAQVLQTAIDLGDQAQIDYVAQLAGADATDRRSTSAKLLALQQKALMGNADARQRMTRLLTAIVPSLKGRKVIDGILNRSYRKTK